MSTEHPKTNPGRREEKMFLQAASQCPNLQTSSSLGKPSGLIADKGLQKIRSMHNKTYFSLPKPYSGPFIPTLFSLTWYLSSSIFSFLVVSLSV